MNAPALLLLIINASAVLSLPKKWAPIPLLATCCYMPIGQGIEIGSISLPIYRLVLAAGLVRVILRRETMVGGVATVDKVVIAWAIWMIFASFFHEKVPGAGPIYAAGFVYNVVLVYFLTRVWCGDIRELMDVVKMIGWLLVPVAAAMLAEHLLKKNLFGVVFGGVSEGVYIRDGAIRAQGPFAHPILAGTVGAVCFPLLIGIWNRYRFSAAIGLIAAITIVLTSTSSGPLMSLVMAIGALVLWFCRSWIRAIRWAAVGVYLLAAVVMTRPAYYLISKIDLTGSSTGWHRSRLIEMAFAHISEWWLFGTDYTFHWMGIAVDEAGRSSDITNYYIWIGTIGGLPAMLLLIAVIWCSFVRVGRSVRTKSEIPQSHRFMIWCLGATLFSHVATSLSVSYTDQSVTFFWLNIGAISSMYAAIALSKLPVEEGATDQKSQMKQVKSSSSGGRYLGLQRGPQGKARRHARSRV